MNEKRENIAKLLLRNQCVKLQPSEPFTYASGLKGPIYCDNRLILGDHQGRESIAKQFSEICSGLGLFDAVCGVATAGIPHGMLLAHILEKPFLYIRSKPKAHGKGNLIEGPFEKGMKLLVVEDLVNQGASLEKALIAMKDSGAEVTDAFCIVDYQMPAAISRMKQQEIHLHSLVDLDTLLTLSKKENSLSPAEIEMVLKWRENPEAWA